MGREKIDNFGEIFNLVNIDFFVGQYYSDLNVGKLLAWAASRNDWHQQLRQQVAEAMQSPDAPSHPWWWTTASTKAPPPC